MNPPTLLAYREGDQLKIWCEHERKWHYHGNGDGHRVAHCNCSNSPLARSGYVLKTVTGPAPRLRQTRSYSCPSCK